MAGLMREDLAAACARDPWDAELNAIRDRWSAESALLRLEGRPPTWIGITGMIDAPAVPWPVAVASSYFAFQWIGFLRAPEEGEYQIALESEDGTRLVLAAEVLDNTGRHIIRIRSMGATLTPGFLPISVDYYHWQSPARCRLLWRAPGEEHLHPIPAEALTHGPDHLPGLATRYYELGQPGLAWALRPSPRRCAWVQALPWRIDLNLRLGRDLHDAHLFAESVPFLEVSVRNHMGAGSEALAQGLLHLDPPDSAGFLALVKNHWGFPAVPDSLVDVIDQVERLGIIPAVIAAMPDGWRDQDGALFARGRFDLAAGQFQEAAEVYDALAGRSWRQNLAPSLRARMAVERVILDRMFNRPLADANAILAEASTPMERAAVDALLGTATWPEAERRMAGKPGGDDLQYYRALWELARGAHDEAKVRFRHLVDEHPQLPQAATAAGILAWYAQQTPGTLQAMPKASANGPSPVTGPHPADF